MAADLAPVVCDNGTGFVKCGFAGNNLPDHLFPSCVGRPTLRAEEDVIGDIELKDVMCGDEADKARRGLRISHPIENGKVLNWDDMEELWNYIFYEKLKVDPSERRIMLTEAPRNPVTNRIKMTEMMFEKYGFEGVLVDIQAVLVLYSQGLWDGVVVDSGDGVTHIVAVVDGTVPANLIQRLDIAGRHVTDKLLSLLQARGYALNKVSDFHAIQQIKEKFCYVPMDAKKEAKLALETTCLMESYTLPDGRNITFDRERYEACNILFEPPSDMEALGVADMLYDVIQHKAAMDLRPVLRRKIVLSGGSTMYPGFSTRLQNDVTQNYLREVLKGNKKKLSGFKLRVEDPPRRKHMVFMGASVYANVMREKHDLWLSKAEFEEEGAERLVRRKLAKLNV